MFAARTTVYLMLQRRLRSGYFATSIYQIWRSSDLFGVSGDVGLEIAFTWERFLTGTAHPLDAAKS
jgi:hypothetical protein